jgi:hypothetical protein
MELGSGIREPEKSYSGSRIRVQRWYAQSESIIIKTQSKTIVLKTKGFTYWFFLSLLLFTVPRCKT